MIQKKICMLGSFAVGKTSLVSCFVSSIFSEKYLTTVGVKVDKKVVLVDDREVTLLLWDIYGQDEFQTVQRSYLRGTAGYLLVVDGTRRATLETACQLQQMAQQAEQGWPIVRTSAKNGAGVEEAFEKLARAMVAG
jgi:hypothetical protein